MIEPTENDVGRMVVYRNFGGRGKIEEGVITSFNDSYVFVRYGVHGTTSAATARGDLEWSHRGPDDLAVETVISGGKIASLNFVPLPTSPRDALATAREHSSPPLNVAADPGGTAK